MAPFKLRFSKMSKSRSNGSKGSRSNSVECDEPGQQLQPNYSNTQTLANCNSRPETPGTEAAAGFPDSPPPSYQHVLEETRLKRSATNTEVDVAEVDEESEENREEDRSRNQRHENTSDKKNDQRRNKNTEIQRSSGGGGGPDGGGGGGGRTPAKGPEIIHKSSKELYRAVAKEWGITCKMSDQCRCFDCQSHYFDCDYEKDEQGKTDGGLGAGTPMFIAEVMHGTACVLL